MKKLIVLLLIVATGFIGCKEDKKEKVETKEEVKQTKNVEKNVHEMNNVDVTNSVLNWKGTKKPSGAHNGTVQLKSGGMIIKDGKLQKGEFVVDMSSIKVLDIPAEDQYNADLVNHLISGDFFDTKAYSTAKFYITDVKENNGKLDVTGNLNIKDITKSITIPATLEKKDGVYVFKSDNFKIDRTDFGIKFKSKKFFNNLKNKFIDDLVEFSFDVKTKK